jgi:hypothetical protein
MRTSLAGISCVLIAFVIVATGFVMSGPTLGADAPTEKTSRTLTEIEGADLVISGMSIMDMSGEEFTEGAAVTSGHPFTLHVTVANIGSADAGEFYLSVALDGVPVDDGLLVQGLHSGGSEELTWSGLAESELGMCTATATVDPTDAVSESNADGTAESNNEASESIEVRAAEWTVAIYMDSDNNLEPYGVLDFLEMASIGSSPDLSIVVQMDRIPGYSTEYGDWTGTERFLVSAGMAPEQEYAYEHMGEVNMGDPSSLYGFATETFQRFQSVKTSLILWDHGMGWIGGCCRDESSSNDSLTTGELRGTMLEVTHAMDGRIDLLGMDCCIMGSIEICYLLRGTCDIYVGSETSIPLEGWPYDTVMGSLRDDPWMSPEQFARVLVSEYALSYEETPWFVTLSAFWTDAVCSDVKGALTGFADAILSASSSNVWGRIQAARTASMDFEVIIDGSSYNDGLCADLYCFASEVSSRVSSEPVQSAALSLMDALEEARIASSVHSTYLPYYDSFGLSIFWPEQELYLEEYASQDLATDSSWDEFLVAFYGA